VEIKIIWDIVKSKKNILRILNTRMYNLEVKFNW